MSYFFNILVARVHVDADVLVGVKRLLGRVIPVDVAEVLVEIGPLPGAVVAGAEAKPYL